MIQPNEIYMDDSGGSRVIIKDDSDTIKVGDPYCYWSYSEEPDLLRSSFGSLEIKMHTVGNGPIHYDAIIDEVIITQIKSPARILLLNPRTHEQTWVRINIIPEQKRYTVSGGPAVGVYDGTGI
jgi:hypothetical protein